MRELSLFTGAGGGLLGTHLLGWTPVCAVEVEPYCREVLLRRQRDGMLPLFPIWDDVKTFDGSLWRGHVDLVTAGFPCQPFSVAGKRKADSDERNLWPDTARIIGEVRPRFALLENVPGLIAHEYFGTVLGDLAALGYDAEWCVLGAEDVGAPHERERLFVLAYTTKRRLQGTEQKPRQERTEGSTAIRTQSTDKGWWITEPALGRVANGVANRVDRLKSIGNGQVPGVVRAAWYLLMDRIA